MTEAESALRSLPVPEGLAGLRLDAGLARLLGVSRTKAAELADAGHALIDGKEAGRSDRLVAGAWLEVSVPSAPSAPVEEDAPEIIPGLNVLYSDEHVVVVEKPPEIAVHPSVGWSGPTVVGGLKALGFHIATTGVAERQGVVQRLDVGTSGVMVLAASEHAYTVLKRAFKHREVEKWYEALVQGHPDPSSGTIDAPIGKRPGPGWRFAVTTEGRHSVTHYDTIEAFGAASLVSVKLETGRTHQIRVHFSALRHPCCGDMLYGADPKLAARLGLRRQWLHARRLSFAHPADGKIMRFESELPQDLQHALGVLRDAV
ncbi:RluA family pseudouridine synthase [Segniliparus rugosus]|uniref:Pseudouridine synthase n=1 Tax=Segniliparus rugosus (strain ATCC BAA-974 / DSM 45345 / CCUG 50838 / CIP 108380 / JCM 13579 / CDC 945) TaxID=679197 RepID=E5XT64_SEGRC|nr:RluA family pseudouridine synthase [Segniliparus rugosus]EFV12475.1 RluA family pseudouridine synthase [Segniliparus rugosus ATCC BAA-974]